MANILGAYRSNLTSWHAEQLLRLAKEAVSLGDYGGGRLFDRAAAEKLRQQAQDFTALPSPSSGSRAAADSLNYPLSLLVARYDAIVAENQDFITRIDQFLSILEKDSKLIEQLIAAARLDAWVARLPPLTLASKFALDFAASHGSAAVSVPLVDPATGVPYLKPVRDVCRMLQGVSGHSSDPVHQGIGVPATVRQVSPITLQWSFEAQGESEYLQGTDWTKLTLLEPAPRVSFGPPTVSVLLPQNGSVSGIYEITGRQTAGNLPVFVQTLFHPRRAQAELQFGDPNVPVTISPKRVVAEDLILIEGDVAYELGVDYQINEFGQIVPFGSLVGKTVTAFYTEMFPAYRCSVNEVDWSPIIMFDPARPYSEGSGPFPLSIDGDRFPIVDESGSPMGLFIRLMINPSDEYLIRVETGAAAAYGVRATMEVEFDRPSFLNSLRISPFSNFPMRVTKLIAEGLETQGTVIWSGNEVFDKEMTLCFDRRLVRRLFVEFLQENYSFKEHLVDPDDKLRKDVLANLQAVLPLSARRTDPSIPIRLTGAQYEFGVRAIAGEDSLVMLPEDTGVFISGPYEVSGSPELIRLDANYSGTVDFYLMDVPFDTHNDLLSSAMLQPNEHGYEITPGEVLVYTPPSEGFVARVRFYVKFVLRSEYAVVERFALQVSHV